MVRKLFLFIGLAAVLFMESCAALKPPVSPTPPPAPEARPYARKFSDFVAVIVQPGDSFSSLASECLKDPSLDWFISEFNGITSLKPGQELIIPPQPYEKGGLTFQGYHTVPVIVYHKFSKNRANRMAVKESTFEAQMKFLRENGYRVIPLEEFFNFLDFKRPIPKKSVVITIDEEWHSTYEIAFPILKKYGYPATFFAYTDFITPKGWDLVKEMSRSGIDVQCHAKTHRNLIKRKGNEPFREYFEAIKKELTESTQIIKKQLDKEAKYLAYPYGDTNRLTIALLKKLGYRGGVHGRERKRPIFRPPIPN